jgi:hypothetical protein
MSMPVIETFPFWSNNIKRLHIIWGFKVTILV